MSYGLAIIAFSWLWQARSVRRGARSLDLWFLRLQIIGWLLIILDTFKSLTAWNSWIGIFSLLILFYIFRKLRK